MNVLPEFVLPMILWRWVCQNQVFHSMFAPLQTKSNGILHMVLVSNAKSEQSTSIYTVFLPSKNKISAVFCQTCTQTISQIAEFSPIRSPLFAVHGHSAGLKIWQDATERHPLLHLPYLLRFTPFTVNHSLPAFGIGFLMIWEVPQNPLLLRTSLLHCIKAQMLSSCRSC